MFHVVAIIAIFALGYMVGLDRAAGVASPSASTTTGQGTGAGHLKPPLKRKAISSPLPF